MGGEDLPTEVGQAAGVFLKPFNKKKGCTSMCRPSAVCGFWKSNQVLMPSMVGGILVT
jgi:hypothetical protein